MPFTPPTQPAAPSVPMTPTHLMPGIHLSHSQANFRQNSAVTATIATVDGADVEVDIWTRAKYPSHACTNFPLASSCVAACPIPTGYGYLVNLGCGQTYGISESQARAFSSAWDSYVAKHGTFPTAHIHTIMKFSRNPNLVGWDTCELIDGKGFSFYGNSLPAPAVQAPTQFQNLNQNVVVNAFNAANAANQLQNTLNQVAQQHRLGYAQNRFNINWKPGDNTASENLPACDCGAHKAMGLKPGQAGHASWCSAC
jgi:hypothetical protein